MQVFFASFFLFSVVHHFVQFVIDDRLMCFPNPCLILRPKSLIAGMGCNRNISANEIQEFLVKNMDQFAFRDDQVLNCPKSNQYVTW